MSPRNKKSDPDQGNLFQPSPDGEAVNPTAIPIDSYPDQKYPQNSIYDRNLNLTDAFRWFGRANQDASLTEGVDQREWNENTERGRAVRARAKKMGVTLDELGVISEEKRESHMVEAERAFFRAVGYEALVASGMDKDEASRLVREDFTSFVREYADVDKASERDDYRRNLKKQQKNQKKIHDNIKAGKKPGEDITGLTIVPNQVEVGEIAKDSTSEEESLELDKLDARDRLQALKVDQRAGFIPSSYKELWQSTELLTFLPSITGEKRVGYQAEVGQYINNVLVHNKKEDRKRGDGVDTASRAPVSLAYEFGDYAIDSLTQRLALIELDKALREDHPNPDVRLSEEFPDGHPGLAALIRYIAVETLREVGGDDTNFKMSLHTVEDRDEDVDSEDKLAKHKTIHDPYTAPEPSEEIKAKIQEFMETTKVGTIRGAVVDAINNEGRRAIYWVKVLDSASRRHLGSKKVISKFLPDVEKLAESQSFKIR